MPAYRFLAADLVTGTIRDEIPFDTVNFGRALSGAATFNATIAVDKSSRILTDRYSETYGELYGSWQTIQRATRANLDPTRTVIYIERDGRIVADGWLTGGHKQPGGRTLELWGQSLWSYFRRRNIRHTFTRTDLDQLQLFRDLIDYAQDQPGGDIGVTVDATVSGVTRDATWESFERKNLGAACEETAGREGGFEFELVCSWDQQRENVLRHIELGYPRRGRRTEFVFEHGTNLDDYGHQVDGARTANQIDAVGAGDGIDMVAATAVDPNLIGLYPLLDDVIAHKTVKNTSTLQGHADAALGLLKVPLELPQAHFKPDGQPRFSSYIPGDEITLKVDDGWVQVNGWYRLAGYQVTVDRDGREDVVATLAGTETS